MEARLKAIWVAIKLAVAIVAVGGDCTIPCYAAGPEARPTVYKLGFLWGLPPIAEWTAAFDQGLAELGWVSGRNIIIEHRSADGHFDRLPALTAELVGLKVNLIVALSAPETTAARKVAEDVPIVFVVHGDPIGTGDIRSLAHPGGNVTGLSQMHPELSTKQLDLLKQIAPNISRVAVLWNAANPAKLADWRELEPAARTLGVVLRSVEVRRPEDFDVAFAAIREQRPDALLTLGDPLTVTMRESLALFALEEGLPAMFTHHLSRSGD
jgi:putative ABC transport system substrate-binding protein